VPRAANEDVQLSAKTTDARDYPEVDSKHPVPYFENNKIDNIFPGAFGTVPRADAQLRSSSSVSLVQLTGKPEQEFYLKEAHNGEDWGLIQSLAAAKKGQGHEDEASLVQLSREDQETDADDEGVVQVHEEEAGMVTGPHWEEMKAHVEEENRDLPHDGPPKASFL